MFLRNTKAVNVKGHGVSESIPEYHFSSSAHLCDIVPHAPCLLVRMLRIFCFSWFAVTWSLCLAALMRWSHIFSSSLRSTAYWAQLDWEVGSKMLNMHQTRTEINNITAKHELIILKAFTGILSAAAVLPYCSVWLLRLWENLVRFKQIKKTIVGFQLLKVYF